MTINDEFKYLIEQIDKADKDKDYRMIKYLNNGLEFLRSFLNKGYTLNADMSKFDTTNIDNVPERDGDELTKLQDSIEELVKLSKLEARIDVFLEPVDGYTNFQSFAELEKSAQGLDDYNELGFIVKDVFEFWKDEDIYKSIMNE